MSVWPSANAEPINILPAVALIEIASLPVPSDDNNNDESPPPVTARVKSLALPPPVVTVTFVASVPSIDTVEPSKVNAPELISTAPVVVISISAAFPWIFTPPLPSSVNAPEDVVIFEAAPASKLIPLVASIVTLAPALKSKLPAVAVIAIASAAVPAVLVNEIFSLPAVPWGVKTISVAPFLPNLSVWPSAKLGAITILPAVASSEIASLPVPSELNNNDELPPPVTDNVKSLPLLPPVVTVTFVESVPSMDTVEPSKVNAPELISTAPVVVISTSAAFPWILTPPLPSSVNAPDDVVKLLAPAESKLIVPVVSNVIPPVPASISNAVAPVALPIVIVLAAAPVPIFMFWATASLPILITPADELIERAPAESMSNPVLPSCLIIASLPTPNLIWAASLLRITSFPNVESKSTCNLPFKDISSETINW